MTKQQLLTFSGMLKNSFDKRFAKISDLANAGAGIVVNRTDETINYNGLTQQQVEQIVTDYLNGKVLQANIVSPTLNTVINTVTIYNETVDIANNSLWDSNGGVGVNIGNIKNFMQLKDRSYLCAKNDGNKHIYKYDWDTNTFTDTGIPSSNGSGISYVATFDGKRIIALDPNDDGQTVEYNLQDDGTYSSREITNMQLSYNNYKGFAAALKYDGLELHNWLGVYKVQEDGQWAKVDGASKSCIDDANYYNWKYFPDLSIAYRGYSKTLVIRSVQQDGTYTNETLNMQDFDSDFYSIDDFYLSLDNKKFLVYGHYYGSSEGGRLYTLYRNDNNEWELVSTNLTPNLVYYSIAVPFETDFIRFFSGNSADDVLEFEQKLSAQKTAEDADILGDGSEIAFYRFEDNTVDEYGERNLTWVGNANYDTGLYGRAAAIVGSAETNRRMKFPDTLGTVLGGKGVTVSGWVKVEEFLHLRSYINIATGDGNYTTQNFSQVALYIDQDTQSIGFNLRDDSNAGLADDDGYGGIDVASMSVDVNTFYHVVGVWDKDNGRAYFYVNGQEVGNHEAGTAGMSSSSGSDYAFIGNHPNDWYNSVIYDNVRVFNRALTAQEVQTIYNIERKQITAEDLDPLGDGSCIAYYKLNDDGSDAEGNYDNAVINSGSYIDGIHGKAVELSTGYISLPLSGVSVDNITITMWVKVNTLSNAEVLGRNDSTRHCLYLNSDGHFNEFDTSLQISQSEWVLLGYKQDSANSGAYLSINGSAWTYSSSAHKMISDIFILGYDHNNGNGGSYLDGAYDNVRIFNKSLTDEEVQTIYNIEYRPNLTLNANMSYADLQSVATLTNVPEAKYETVVDKGFSWFVSDGDIHKASIPFTQYGTYIKIVVFVDDRVANAENFIDIYRIDDSSTPTTVYQVADSSVESEGIVIRKDGGNTVVASGENLYGQEFTFTGELISMQDNNLYIKFYCGDGNIIQPMYIKELSIDTKPFD